MEARIAKEKDARFDTVKKEEESLLRSRDEYERRHQEWISRQTAERDRDAALTEKALAQQPFQGEFWQIQINFLIKKKKGNFQP